jgi:hypothetical protein
MNIFSYNSAAISATMGAIVFLQMKNYLADNCKLSRQLKHGLPGQDVFHLV